MRADLSVLNCTVCSADLAGLAQFPINAASSTGRERMNPVGPAILPVLGRFFYLTPPFLSLTSPRPSFSNVLQEAREYRRGRFFRRFLYYYGTAK
jgi:hypothetical protein